MKEVERGTSGMRVFFFLGAIALIAMIWGFIHFFSEPNPIDEQRRFEKVVESVSELKAEAEEGNESAQKALDEIKAKMCITNERKGSEK